MKFYQKLIINILCVSLAGVFSSLALAKPLSPVQVSITPSQPPASGQPMEFVVRATTSMDADNLRIEISVPRPINVLSGELDWQGPLLKGQEKQLRFTAILPGNVDPINDGPLIQVRAAIIAQAGAEQTNAQQINVQQANVQQINVQQANAQQGFSQLGASAFYLWQTAVARAAYKSRPVNSRVVERDGRKIQEYELRP